MAGYDVIVVGTGGVGSAALFELARRGARVVGIDRFPPAHDRGSSHGQTRAIRKAYYEHPNYVPLVHRAYHLWAELERRRSQQLYHEVGLLQVGPPDGMVISGVLDSARLHGLEIERLSSRDVRDRFAGFVVPEDAAAVFERCAGYLLVEDCVIAHLQEASKLGADLCNGQVVRSWRADRRGVSVQTDADTFTAGHLVITGGAWAGSLLADLGILLKVLRKHLHWFAGGEEGYRAERGCPVFFFETAEGFYYGFPQLDHRGVKVGEHSGGSVVTDPLNLARDIEPGDLRRVASFVGTYMPGLSRRATDHAVCMYTMSPDEHFLVDRHPEHDRVLFAAGLSGHGFKFVGVLAEALADLALQGKTSLPIEFLSCTRPGLR